MFLGGGTSPQVTWYIVNMTLLFAIFPNRECDHDHDVIFLGHANQLIPLQIILYAVILALPTHREKKLHRLCKILPCFQMFLVNLLIIK